eukprot:SAG11_NODE_2756_length_3006_cov_8.607155_1_plen_538_part_10
MWADTTEIKSQISEDEASYCLLILMQDCHHSSVHIPTHWLENGGPSTGWWQKFYKRHPNLSIGKANRLEEVRVTAHTPIAIKKWKEVIMEPNEDGWFGFTPEGMEKYLRSEMPHIIEGWTDVEIKARAYALCHDPRLQCNFDQKGHAMGGSEVKVISCKYSRRPCRDITDGTWCSLCPLVNAAGVLLFIALVIKGSFDVDPKLAEVLWGPDTCLASSATGYSSSEINLEQWKIGIAKLKAERPELFPMCCWLDSWEGHVSMEFRTWCRDEGIILMFFRSHATVWSCMLDNGAFGEYERTYNKEIHRLKKSGIEHATKELQELLQARKAQMWRRDIFVTEQAVVPAPAGSVEQAIKRTAKLPLLVCAMAIRKACDKAFTEKVLVASARRTIWKEKGGEEKIQLVVGRPMVLAVEFSVEKAYNYACEMIDESPAVVADAGTGTPQTAAARKVLRRTEIVQQKLCAAERVWKSIILPRLPLARGTNVERRPDGTYVCQHCRQHAEHMKQKAQTRKWGGGGGGGGGKKRRRRTQRGKQAKGR